MDGLRGLIDTSAANAASKPLTLSDLQAAFDAIANQPYPEPHRHLIAASAKPGSLVACAACGMPVRVPDGWGS